ncbi:Smr/MutS family protein [Kineosporia sp. J2-2]|uniref:Smr/MutS family protein n=1 Tax=Kineosporia corallincola TaxID=2835133 RepID=A0ABS5TKV6_9ACTN|nr:Smr/MutS family protein [Kineosporia corallincola]MBT0771473.1 Smr/MutS family protein [Kineosporia corallincola]
MLSLDLHPVFRSKRDIDTALRTFIVRAAATGQREVEIIPGKGTGQLRQKVLTFLGQPHVRRLYRSYRIAPGNEGKIIVTL